LRNGPNDSVSLGAGSGGDYIATGTGSGDMVDVVAHTHADIFAFALGTNGTDFTTVAGALVGDKVEVNNGQLGGTLVNEGESASYTSLAAFISAIAAHVGHTYVGNNGTDTFIYTDTSGGQTGAIEIAGTFAGSSPISNHVLTLAAST
jgi:hypothetical protein